MWLQYICMYIVTQPIYIHRVTYIMLCILEAVEKNCSKAIKHIRNEYSRLTTSFPIDGLLPRLYSKEVIDQEQKEAIQVKKLRSKKVSFLFDEVIIPELEAGISTKYDNLIEVMKASDDSLAKHLVELLQGNYVCNYCVQ